MTKTHYDESDGITAYWNAEWGKWFPEPSIPITKDAWWEQRFSHILPPISEEQRVAEFKTVLDYGCGACWYAPALMRRFEYYVGLDTGSVPLSLSRQFIEPVVDPFRWTTDQIERGSPIPYDDEHFDAVMTITVLQHQPPEMRCFLIGEIKRVLRSGGLYLGLEMQGDTQAPDMPQFPVSDWKEAWLPLVIVEDDPPVKAWVQDNVWVGRKP